MALLDIVNEISEKQVYKTETGDQRIWGVVIGIVTENYHKDMPGKVRVQIPIRDEDANVLKWAKIARPYSGKDWSFYYLPEINDQVLLAFEHGNIEMPYIIGAVPRDNDGIIRKSADEDNQIKQIVTKHGSSLVFEDHKEGDGEKDKIRVLTAGKAHELLLDNENKKILFSDKEKHCVVEMKTEDGEIKITAEKKLRIQVGDTIKINLNGENGTIRIEADKFQVNASKSMECKTDGTAKISGQQTIIDASSSLKVNSNGMVTIAGSPIKIG